MEEAINKKKAKVVKIRKALNDIDKLTNVEKIQLWNLMPNNIEDAIGYIPSLERLKITGDTKLIVEAMELLNKNSF